MVSPRTVPIWPSSQAAPSATQLPKAAEHAVDAEAGHLGGRPNRPAPDTAEATWQTGPSPVAARAAAAAGQGAGQAGQRR